MHVMYLGYLHFIGIVLTNTDDSKDYGKDDNILQIRNMDKQMRELLIKDLESLGYNVRGTLNCEKV